MLLFIMNHLLVNMLSFFTYTQESRRNIVFLYQVQQSISNKINHLTASNPCTVNTVVFVIGWSLINSWTSSDWKDSHPHKSFSAKEYEPLSEIEWWDYTILSWDNHLIVSELLNTLNLCTAIFTWWVECFFFCLWSLWYLIGHPLFWCSYDFLSCCCISFLIKWKEKWTTTLSDSFSFKTTKLQQVFSASSTQKDSYTCQ